MSGSEGGRQHISIGEVGTGLAARGRFRAANGGLGGGPSGQGSGGRCSSPPICGVHADLFAGGQKVIYNHYAPKREEAGWRAEHEHCCVRKQQDDCGAAPRVGPAVLHTV